jgi:hypothetical protein
MRLVSAGGPAKLSVLYRVKNHRMPSRIAAGCGATERLFLSLSLWLQSGFMFLSAV